MGAITVILTARSRRYWRAWLALALLIALGTGLVLAAATAGRRADSAFPRFVTAHGYDAIVYASQPLPLATLPEVAEAVAIVAPFEGQPWCSCGKAIAGGVAVAYGLSPLAPAGEARLADPTPGLAFDGPVAAIGAAGSLTLVLALGLVPALRMTGRVTSGAARVPGLGKHAVVDRPSRLMAALAATGLPLAAVLGIRQALEHGRGSRATPVGTALAGTAAAVAALCATAVFGASLAHLIASPELYGDPFQVYFSSAGPGSASSGSLLADLQRDPAIEQLTLATVPAITVDKTDVRALAVTPVRGPLLLSGVEGRLPAATGEIALGPSTMRAVGASLGGTVTVTVADPDGVPRSSRFRVVGELAFPADFGTGGLGTGAALTTAAYVAAQCPSAVAQPKCRREAQARPADGVLVRAVPGPAGTAALARHIRQHPGDSTIPAVPTALVSFGESANFPLLLGIIVALCGTATLVHLLIVSVARRRAESALLAALGFVRRQLAAVVLWQSAAVAVIGIALGVPVGIAVGRAIWRAFAVGVGVVPLPVIPGWLIAALAAGVLAAALAIAAIPALIAARSRPAGTLRAE